MRVPYFILNSIKNKMLYFKIAHSLEGPFPRNIGVAQGSISGPTIYIAYVKNLPKITRQKSPQTNMLMTQTSC